MASTFGLFSLFTLMVLVGVAVYWFVVSYRYKRFLDCAIYTRGANVKDGGTVALTCDSEKVISIISATQICTLPNSSNFESSNLEPIANGTNAPYGNFDPKTTVDLTSEMKAVVDGQQKINYTFSGASGWSKAGLTCNGNAQLIATYECVPKNDTGCPAALKATS